MAGIKQTGGSRIGKSYWWSVRSSPPLATLEVTEDEIILKAPLGGALRFLRKDITRLSWKRELFGTGLRIEHSVSAYSPFILFRTPDWKSLSASLKELGYPIEN